MDLNNKNVAFVAGFGGIGYEFCKELMTRNLANLAVLDIADNPTALQNLQSINKATQVFFVRIDVGDKDLIRKSIKEVINRMKFIDVLVNGAGIVRDRNVDLTISVNLTGLIHTTMEVLPYMDKRKGGRGGIIANIASVYGLEPCASHAVYTASKFGVVGFTRSISDSFYYNLTGVAVMTLCPGLTKTPLIKEVLSNDTFDYSGELSQKIIDAEMQNAEDCGKNFVKAIESNENGAIWIADRGTLQKAEPKIFWRP